MKTINPGAEAALTAALYRHQDALAGLYRQTWSSLAQTFPWASWLQQYQVQRGLPLSTTTILEEHFTAALEGAIEERLLRSSQDGAGLIVDALEAKAFEGLRDVLRNTMGSKIKPKVKHYVDQQRSAMDAIASEVTQRAPQTLARAVRALQQTAGLTAAQALGWIRRHRAASAEVDSADAALDVTGSWSLQSRRERSKRISVTETADAFNVGMLTAILLALSTRVLDKPPIKVWQTHIDERTCQVCTALDGAVADLEEHFEQGGLSVLVPPIHVHCRCTMHFIV